MNNSAGIYIHIPFCERKCVYCNFNTTDFFEDLASRYIEAVKREIAHWGRRLIEDRQPDQPNDRLTVDTIFFGGGTPSMVEAAHLASLIASCRQYFRVTPDAEITIEINPATFSPRRLEEWRASGINRASVGVQSFIDKELIALSRTHTADDARRTVASLREAGFDNISLDLIAGLPDQTLANWRFNLEESLKLAPEHLSLYLLEVKEGTQLFAQIKRGQRARPDDDLAADMYRALCDAARGAGYEHYEISNFALAREHDSRSFRSKHNMKYWTDSPFYGMGCGAHSYDRRARWVNILKTERYIDEVMNKGEAISEQNALSHRDRAAEALFMGLRLIEGIHLEGFRSEYDLDIESRYSDDLARLNDAGLIEISDGRLRLTEPGLLLSNEVFEVFI